MSPTTRFPGLAKVPAQLVTKKGQPRVGTYAGGVSQVLLSTGDTPALDRLAKLFTQKRWQFVTLSTGDLLFSAALVDAGILGKVFVSLADLKTGETLVDESFMAASKLNLSVNDRPGKGASAFYRGTGGVFELSRPEAGTKYQLQVEVQGLKIRASLDTAGGPQPLSVVGQAVPTGPVFTQKTNLLRAQGSLRLGESTYALQDALAGLDFTSGFLPRITEWRWAFALGRLGDGTPLGLNLAEGNNLGGQLENALWIGNRLFGLGPVEFDYISTHYGVPWKITAPDGSVDLEFQPRAIHREEQQLVVAESRFAQLSGLYRGTLRHPRTGETLTLEAVPGLAEDQRVRW